MIIQHNPVAQLIHQLGSFYPYTTEYAMIEYAYEKVVGRLEYCFSHVNNKYYHDNGETIFNPLHVGQWTMFLYMMASELNKTENNDLCNMIYGLSKVISSADIFYAVEMPEIWFFDHPQGSVMGRAKYKNYFTFSQGCTVGNNKGVYPSFGEHVSMMSGSKVLGNCHIGDHVILAANSFIIDQDIPSYSIVFGMSRDSVIKPISPETFNELTKSMF